jgi:hypothetical protein
MNNCIKVLSAMVDTLIDDEDIADEDIYQLGVRLQILSQECFDSIDYSDD